MPIICDLPIRVLTQNEFGAIAFDVMHHAFAIHNEMGRFFDELVYQQELMRRLGDRAKKEVIVRATHGDFEKPYRLDLLVDGGAMFELKAVGQLHKQHCSQLIHYLMMTGIEHGKLINFRPEQVEHEFVNCTQSRPARQAFQVNNDRWDHAVPGAEKTQHIITEILQDWGTGLDLQLYTDAVTHFFGGHERVEQEIDIYSHDQQIGRQTARLVNPTTAFKMTALGRDLDAFESHTRRFLDHTKLEYVLWINITFHEVTFTVISKE